MNVVGRYLSEPLPSAFWVHTGSRPAGSYGPSVFNFLANAFAIFLCQRIYQGIESAISCERDSLFGSLDN